MSKELEALYKLGKLEFETGDYMNDYGYMMSVENTEIYEILEKALTPPTSDEVCEAIENDIEWETEFKDNGFYFKNSEGYIVKLDDKGKLLYNLHPTPKTSSIISRFYEAQE